MSYTYTQVNDRVLADSLHVRVVKSDESYAVIGESENVARYVEVVNVV